jgi:hypothetical protein
MNSPRHSEECQHCQLFSGFLGDEYPVCGIHPHGPTENSCPDFAPISEQCEPLGTGYYDGELVIQPAHYLTTADRLEILNTHPFFTNKCPRCGSIYIDVPAIHWDCPNLDCGWKDDLIV